MSNDNYEEEIKNTKNNDIKMINIQEIENKNPIPKL